MAANVQPGQWITVRVLKTPLRAAACKTLTRLFEMTPEVRKERRRLKRARPVRGHIRGGRIWKDRPPKVDVVRIVPGATCRLFASVDILRDLDSVSRFVEITPA